MQKHELRQIIKEEISKALDKNIKDGDIYDIGQTVNGFSKFLWKGGKWFYYAPQMMEREYEYSQKELTDLIYDDEINGWGEVEYVGNILSN